MTGRGKILIGTGAAAGALLLALALLFYTAPGLVLVARLVGVMSGGTVQVTGLSGVFPNHLRAARIDIADKAGVWLQIEDIRLDWSAPSALFNHIAVDAVSAGHIMVLRRPLPSPSEGGEEPTIDIAHLSAPRIDLAAAVLGHPIGLSASGTLHYASPRDLTADLSVTQRGGGGRYRIDGSIVQGVANGHVTFSEDADGILGKLIGLPGIGPVQASAQAHGDATRNVLSFTVSAGALQARGGGVIKLAASRADLDFSVSSSAMAPRTGMGWRSLTVKGHYHGSFDAPRIDAHLDIQDAHFDGIAAARLMIDAQGAGGGADMMGRAEGVMIPGGEPGLFAHTPLALEAHADLAAKDRPVTFVLHHQLAVLQGHATLAGTQALTAEITIPALAPFVAARGTDLNGKGTFSLTARRNDGRFEIGLDGTLDTGGTALAARLLGHAELSLRAQMEDGDIRQSRLTFKGRAVSGDMAGTWKKDVLAYRVSAELSDLSRLHGRLRGKASLHGTINGPLATAVVKAEGEAQLAAAGHTPRRIALALNAEGLPMPAKARLSANGNLNGAPLHLLATLAGRTQHRLNLAARWKSLSTEAHLTLTEHQPPHGTLHLVLAHISDTAPFTGSPLSGGMEIRATLTGHGKQGDAAFHASLTTLASGGARLAALSAQGMLADFLGKPVLTLQAQAQGLSVAGFSGGGTLKADGPLASPDTELSLTMKDSSGNPALLSAAAQLNGTTKTVSVTAFKGQWRGATLTLDHPAVLSYGNGFAITHLAAHLGGGTLTATGAITPNLSLEAAAQGIRLEDIPGLMPSAGLAGILSARITLSGTIAAPLGHVALAATGLRAAATGNRIAPATVKADIQLAATQAQIDARFQAGDTVDLALTGSAPLSATAAMDMQAKGKLDLALFDPLLAPAGRRARGTLVVDAAITGTPNMPHVTGGAELTSGEIQDYARGFRLSGIAASITAQGTRLTIARLTGRAGDGTLSASGTIDLAAPDLPVAMTLSTSNARPMVSDLFSATLNGTLALKGHVRTDLDLSGALDIARGQINLPENFPPEVAVLNVRHRGRPAPPSRTQPGRIRLDVAVRTSGPIFVRGRGIDAVMEGDMHLSGLVTQPQVGGSFHMVRGSYTLGGQTLNFDNGSVTFDGSSVSGRLDPALNFRTHTESGGVTANLTVTGYASAPKIALSSSPSLPQDEIVAHLLFQQSTKQLSPLQLASIAQALAAMGGVGGGFDPLATVRQTLGLDRLAVGSAAVAGQAQSQTTVEAGRYLANGIYVGVKQNLAGGTQTQVQIDITRQLKAQATLATGTSAAPSTTLHDNGSSVGLSYQFEY